MLTTRTTDETYMHKHCATAQKIGNFGVSGPLFLKKMVPDKKWGLTGVSDSGIIMYN